MEQLNQPKYDILSNIKRLHKGYWFSPDSMRFFQSKVYSGAVAIGDTYYFVSSEKTAMRLDVTLSGRWIRTATLIRPANSSNSAQSVKLKSGLWK